ncbi:hypothetical protein GGI35DRAFT_149975 [Trichoderma velutinum]
MQTKLWSLEGAEALISTHHGRHMCESSGRAARRWGRRGEWGTGMGAPFEGGAWCKGAIVIALPGWGLSKAKRLQQAGSAHAPPRSLQPWEISHPPRHAAGLGDMDRAKLPALLTERESRTVAHKVTRKWRCSATRFLTATPSGLIGPLRCEKRRAVLELLRAAVRCAGRIVMFVYQHRTLVSSRYQRGGIPYHLASHFHPHPHPHPHPQSQSQSQSVSVSRSLAQPGGAATAFNRSPPQDDTPAGRSGEAPRSSC